ncbi:MAG: hypothetical protein ACTSRA_07270 [Promethearchaeota archaeon]
MKHARHCSSIKYGSNHARTKKSAEPRDKEKKAWISKLGPGY